MGNQSKSVLPDLCGVCGKIQYGQHTLIVRGNVTLCQEDYEEAKKRAQSERKLKLEREEKYRTITVLRSNQI